VPERVPRCGYPATPAGRVGAQDLAVADTPPVSDHASIIRHRPDLACARSAATARARAPGHGRDKRYLLSGTR
jgi:hypothetical protein